MAICPSCQKKLKWYHFKREICPACSKNWNGVLAKADTEAPPITEPAPLTADYLDLGSLLESIHVKESLAVDAEVFANVWAPGGYPTRSFAASLVIHACMVGLIYGLSGVSFGKTLPFTRAALERDYEITYYRPQDLLPKINSAKDGPKPPAGKKPDVKPPKGSTEFHPTQTIQSSPLQADNESQTIVQPSAPQLLKQEVKVPNIVIWNVPETNVETLQIASKQIAAPMMQKPDAALPQLRPPDADGKRRGAETVRAHSGQNRYCQHAGEDDRENGHFGRMEHCFRCWQILVRCSTDPLTIQLSCPTCRPR